MLQSTIEEEKQYVCGVCYRQFAYNYTLRKHLREKHPSEAPPLKERKAVVCPLCPAKLNSTDFYTEHLIKYHDVALERERIEFASQEEFYDWKKGVEGNHRYVQSRGGRTQVNGFSVTVYECHRSGMYISRGEGKRKLKNQGSKKINGLCPAKIKASVSERGVVLVEFIKTHVGHDLGEKHILLSQEEREVIVEMIKSKDSFDDIIENLKGRPGASKRLQAVTKKDLHNIVCSYKLKEFVQTQAKKSKRIRNDTTDVLLELNKQNETPTKNISEDHELSPDVIFFPGDQHLITDNIFILGLTETPYTDELSFQKEKDRIKNEFLDMIDSIGSREQLESVKNALSPFLPNLQTHQPVTFINSPDVTYNLASFYDDKTTIKICH